MPPCPTDHEAAPHGWDAVPCGLVSLDEHDQVVSANTRYLERTGHATGDVLGRVFWTELLAVGSRVFYYTQLAPVLELEGTLEEIMVDLRTAAGGRLPALLNAARVRTATGFITHIALMSVPDRREYEGDLRRARNEAEEARAGEHRNSVALQQALLTSPPPTPGLQIVTRYLPATLGNEVGGDWYDVFVQPDGKPVLVIGDVVGHDIHAAAAMGQLRNLLRALGYTEPGSPAHILSRTDAAASGLAVEVLASALVVLVERTGADTATLRWSNAGHPPPLLLTTAGPRLLNTAPGRLLGLGAALQRPRTDHQLEFRIGDTLLLYTDGLVEHRGENIDAGFARLVGNLSGAAASDLDDVCDLALADRPGETRDDIALLALRLAPLPNSELTAR